jgi:signal transduction histidine kinase
LFNPSLRARAILGGTVWIAFALSLSGFVLFVVFDDIMERRFNVAIGERLERIAAVIAIGDAESLNEIALAADPRFREPGGGLYWQATGPDGVVIRSLSLGPVVLSLANPSAIPQKFDAYGPMGEPLRVHARLVIAPDGGRWVAYAAESLATLNVDKADFRKSALGALIALGASLILAGAAQTGMALGPLNTLRSAFRAYRSGRDDRVRGAYPADIEPLVEDLNVLLERNGRILVRARRQAADLAHSLKTPAAILRNEIDRVDGGDPKVIRDALDRIEMQMARQMARARLAGPDAPRASSDPAEVLEGLVRLFARMSRDGAVSYHAEIPPGRRVRVDIEDMEELFGNLIENASKFARSEVRIDAAVVGDDMEIRINDDGPGIRADDRAGVLQAGVRLDAKKPGSGLGLAIASDIVEVYGGALELGDSPLGGLQVRCVLPLARD